MNPFKYLWLCFKRFWITNEFNAFMAEHDLRARDPERHIREQYGDEFYHNYIKHEEEE
jgi:hypothetical protein